MNDPLLPEATIEEICAELEKRGTLVLAMHFERTKDAHMYFTGWNGAYHERLGLSEYLH